MQVSEFRLGIDGVGTAELSNGSTKTVDLVNAVVINPDGSLNSGLKVVALNGNTVAVTNNFYDVDASVSEVVITLPAANQSTGKSIVVTKKDSSANHVRILGSINADTVLVLTQQYTSVTLMSTETEWRIV